VVPTFTDEQSCQSNKIKRMHFLRQYSAHKSFKRLDFKDEAFKQLHLLAKMVDDLKYMIE